MRVVGKRQQYDIVSDASAAKLVAGARWNDAMNKAFGTGQPGVFRCGVYRYRSHEEADAAWFEAVVRRMATIAAQRNG
ncbi:MAG: hypothetical protein N3C63_10480 [Rhodocyclaceae bacterium]|nr:hypothetical protein [Rhodocyclaceae bacterium]